MHLNVRDKPVVLSQARKAFGKIFDEMLTGWTTSEFAIKSELGELTIKYVEEAGIVERKPGSTIYCFTENFRTFLAETMRNFSFPLDGREPDIPEITPEVVEVKVERNKNPGYSLRILRLAYKEIQEKIEKSERVLKDLNEDYPVDKPQYTEVKVAKLTCELILMDNGLFLIPHYAFLDPGGMWEARWSEEEIQEFRILIQA